MTTRSILEDQIVNIEQNCNVQHEELEVMNKITYHSLQVLNNWCSNLRDVLVQRHIVPPGDIPRLPILENLDVVTDVVTDVATDRAGILFCIIGIKFFSRNMFNSSQVQVLTISSLTPNNNNNLLADNLLSVETNGTISSQTSGITSSQTSGTIQQETYTILVRNQEQMRLILQNRRQRQTQKIVPLSDVEKEILESNLNNAIEETKKVLHEIDSGISGDNNTLLGNLVSIERQAIQNVQEINISLSEANVVTQATVNQLRPVHSLISRFLDLTGFSTFNMFLLSSTIAVGLGITYYIKKSDSSPPPPTVPNVYQLVLKPQLTFSKLLKLKNLFKF